MTAVRKDGAGITEQDIPGGWSEQSVTIGERVFSLLLPADPDRFLDHLEEEPHADNRPRWPDPYWAKLWPMSVELAGQVMQANWPAETKVIEIGCGCGMAGMAALAKGWNVAFSDYIPSAMELALENARRNGLGGRTLFLDWRRPDTHAFDVVLASEILYDRALHGAILQTLERLILPGGFIWAADPGRTATEEFIPRAEAAGWKIDIRAKDGKPVPKLQFNQFNLIEMRRAAA